MKRNQRTKSSLISKESILNGFNNSVEFPSECIPVKSFFDSIYLVFFRFSIINNKNNENKTESKKKCKRNFAKIELSDRIIKKK